MPIKKFYVASDAMGSVTAILDEEGNVLERRSYDAFGEMTSMSPDGTPVATSHTGVDVGFQGQVREEVTGHYQMGYRWFTPCLGRWLSRDPIGLMGSLNSYASLLNNPSSLDDASGLSTVKITLTNGTQFMLTDKSNKDLRATLAGIAKCTIAELEIHGHAEWCGIKTGPNTGPNGDDGLVTLPLSDGYHVVYSDDSSVKFADTLRDKLACNGVVRLRGCNTAQSSPKWYLNLFNVEEDDPRRTGETAENISRQLSSELPGIKVVGFRGYAFGNEITTGLLREEKKRKHWRFWIFENSVSVHGIGRTYLNGKEMP
jgi:RHS repeat-associated protein